MCVPEHGLVAVDVFTCSLLVLQEKAAEVLGAYRRSDLASSPVLAFAELSGLCSDICADESTLCMALLQLQRDKQATVCLHDGEKVTSTSTLGASWRSADPMTSDLPQVVKFCQRGQERVSPVSDVDVGIYQLQRSEKLLVERVERLEAEAQR